jgi:hypothetical protein
MLQALKQSKIHLPSSPIESSGASGLAKELEVTIDPSTTTSPSHILAVFSRPSRTPTSPTTSSNANKVTLHLAHALPLAAQCSALPVSTFAGKVKQTVEESTTWTLPVVPIALPDSAGWGILMGYLYTKNTIGLISSLLPLSPQLLTSSEEPKLDIATIAAHLGHTFSAAALASIAQKVHGLWANAITLGIYDEQLWDAIDVCWFSVLEAFKRISLKGKGKANAAITATSQS